MRSLAAASMILALALPVSAQAPVPDPVPDPETVPVPDAAPDTAPDTAPEPEPEPAPDTAAEPTPTAAPKVAVVVVGDPDERARSLARRIDDALEPALRRPFDPGLRRALRGELGEDDDGLAEVRRDRRRLGAGEARDAPVLASLGRRAGALVVALVRHADDGPELVIFDVRNAAFYEGGMTLGESTSTERILSFVRRRARASQRRGAVDPSVVAEQAQVGEEPPDEEEEEEEEEPDFFEEYWPYLVAAALLGGMIAAIAATSATDATSQPVLRFVPGGR